MTEQGRQVEIIAQARKTLAMRVTPAGIRVLVPRGLAADSPRAQAFIAAGLTKLKQLHRLSSAQPLRIEEVKRLVDGWAEEMGVEIKRVQIRAMRTKWASCSAKGILTLSADLPHLSRDLIDYIIVHELAHLKIPDHNRGFQALIGCYIPDWREREQWLAGWVMEDDEESHAAREGDSLGALSGA